MDLWPALRDARREGVEERRVLMPGASLELGNPVERERVEVFGWCCWGRREGGEGRGNSRRNGEWELRVVGVNRAETGRTSRGGGRLEERGRLDAGV
jgi:hypothetical protein